MNAQGEQRGLYNLEGYIRGPSVHNTRIEGFWSHMRQRCTQFWINFFSQMGDTSTPVNLRLDSTQDSHKLVLQHVSTADQRESAGFYEFLEQPFSFHRGQLFTCSAQTHELAFFLPTTPNTRRAGKLWHPAKRSQIRGTNPWDSRYPPKL